MSMWHSAVACNAKESPSYLLLTESNYETLLSVLSDL